MTVDKDNEFFDLRAMAHQVMHEEGFTTDMPPDVMNEVRRHADSALSIADHDGVRDLRSLLWSSVDNPDSRDLDQIEVAERLPDGDIRLLVGIADVDAYVPKRSLTDRHAAHNTTSVYLGVETFPMLPEPFSHDLTSLLPGQDRLAVVAELRVNPDGTLQGSAFYRALVRNHAKLNYTSLGPWLEGYAPLPPEVAAVPGLEEQIRLQAETMDRFQALRHKNGALDFETIEATPVMLNDKVVDLMVVHKSQSRFLIENFMVAVNGATAAFLMDNGVPTIERVVRTPKRWSRIVELAAALGYQLPSEPNSRALAAFLERRRQKDPDRFPDLSLSVVKLLGAGEYAVVREGEISGGHFGLAVQGYTHSTAPNRRYPDLITQRMLKAVLADEPVPYTEAELEAIAAHCTEQAMAAAKVERRMRKAAAAVLLEDRIGDVFEAIITGVSEKGTFARLLAPPAEGRVIRGERGMDVGDRVQVRLIGTDPEKGFIDFARA
jgi:VacB/RNase II family 3'-5' exoribonuclease